MFLLDPKITLLTCFKSIWRERDLHPFTSLFVCLMGNPFLTNFVHWAAVETEWTLLHPMC